MRRLALSRSTIFGFAIVLLLQLLLSVVVYRSIVALMKANDWITHTEDVLATLESLLAQAQDAEVERGYLLTGDELFLAPYQTARQVLGPTLQRLQQLTTDNPLSQARLATLGSLVKQRLTLAQSVIDVRQAKGSEVALRLVQSGRGRALMAEIRSLVDGLRSEEVALLQQRRTAANRNGWIAFWMMVLSNVVLLVFVVFVGCVMQKDRAKRKSAERVLLHVYTKAGPRVEGYATPLLPESGELPSESTDCPHKEPSLQGHGA